MGQQCGYVAAWVRGYSGRIGACGGSSSGRSYAGGRGPGPQRAGGPSRDTNSKRGSGGSVGGGTLSGSSTQLDQQRVRGSEPSCSVGAGPAFQHGQQRQEGGEGVGAGEALATRAVAGSGLSSARLGCGLQASRAGTAGACTAAAATGAG